MHRTCRTWYHLNRLSIRTINITWFLFSFVKVPAAQIYVWFCSDNYLVFFWFNFTHCNGIIKFKYWILTFNRWCSWMKIFFQSWQLKCHWSLVVLDGNGVVVDDSVFGPFSIQIIQNWYMITYTLKISYFRPILNADLAPILLERWWVSSHAEVLHLL